MFKPSLKRCQVPQGQSQTITVVAPKNNQTMKKN